MMVGALTSLTRHAIVLGSNSSQQDLRYGAMFASASGCFLYEALTNAQISAGVLSDTSRSSVSVTSDIESVDGVADVCRLLDSTR